MVYGFIGFIFSLGVVLFLGFFGFFRKFGEISKVECEEVRGFFKGDIV